MFSYTKRQSSVYEKLPGQDQDVYTNLEPTPNTQIPWARKSSSYFRTIIFVILLAVLATVTGLMFTFKPVMIKYSELEYRSCGHTPTEARNAGCRFEPMMSAWVPEKCSFQELIDDTTGTFENYDFFSDGNITQQITGAELDGIKVGNYTKVYSSHGTGHDLHCLYAWRKLNFALEVGAKLIDTKSRSLHHTTHCAKHIAQLLDEGAGFLPNPMADPDMQMVAVFPLLFLNCVPIV